MQTVLDWINENAGALQVLASVVLALVTLWYVRLTSRMARAAWASHQREITPNVLVLDPVVGAETRFQPDAQKLKSFFISNLSSGTVLIKEARVMGWVGDQRYPGGWEELHRRVIPSGTTLRIPALRMDGEVTLPQDILRERLRGGRFDRLHMTLQYFHGPSGSTLFEDVYELDYDADPPRASRLSQSVRKP